jgi:hypothetical protein
VTFRSAGVTENFQIETNSASGESYVPPPSMKTVYDSVTASGGIFQVARNDPVSFAAIVES